jgi:hypothetical protein
LEVSVEAWNQIRPLPANEVEENVAGEEKEGELELPLDERVAGVAFERPRRG